MKSIHPRLVFIILLLLTLACAGLATAVPELSETLPPGPIPNEPATETPFQPGPNQTDTALPSPLSGATAAVTSTPQPNPTTAATIPPVLTHPQIVTLADHLSQPDDLLLAPDGSIYLTDVGDGTLRRYTQTSGLQLLLSGLNEPEGMVLLPDGAMIIVEQGTNRLLRYDLKTQSLTPFLDLSNTTRQPGVDNIAWDAATQTIIVPDSPNGTVLRLNPATKTLTQIASGFTRPTGAWVEPDGSLLVVDEYGNSLDRIHTDGSIEKVRGFSTPDDVIEDNNGNIFVVTLGDNGVHYLSGSTHQDIVLTRQAGGPQGIIFDADGNLIVADPGNHRLIKLVIH